MDNSLGILCVRLARTVTMAVIASFFCCHTAAARNYFFENISDLPTGPGGGYGAVVNESGDIAFLNDGDVWFHDRSENSFLNVTALPGAPANPSFVKLNNDGNLAIIESATTTRDLWLFEQGTQVFTNISGLANFPATGNSGVHFAGTAFDLNDNNKVSFHSGDLNFGDIYVYDHAAGDFDKITDMPGGPSTGRENEINNLDQVLYMGFPSTYLFDPATNTTTNINTLPGGPGPVLTNLDLNDQGDVALISASVAQLYDASTGSFLDVTATPGWPPDILASSGSDLSNSGEITFWREGLFVFDSNANRFSQLNGFPGGPPPGGTVINLNSSGHIVFAGGGDIYLATPRPYGDFNNDGMVDGGDLPIFSSTYGNTVAIGTGADGDSDGSVDGRDFLLWQRNFGQGTSPLTGGYVAVPEPTAVGLLFAAMLFGVAGRSCAGFRTFRHG